VLVDQGSLDDARLARAFTHDKRELEQWGSERIRRGLVERGIGAELIEAVLGDDGGEEGGAAAGQEGGELDRALAVLSRRLPCAPRDRRERDRALGVLLRKGYEPEIALEALARFARPAARYYDPVND
jgi:regulatory protein